MQHDRKAPLHLPLWPVLAKKAVKLPDVNARKIDRIALLHVMERV